MTCLVFRQVWILFRVTACAAQLHTRIVRVDFQLGANRFEGDRVVSRGGIGHGSVFLVGVERLPNIPTYADTCQE